MVAGAGDDGASIRALAEAFARVVAARGTATAITTTDRSIDAAGLAASAGGIAQGLREGSPHGTVILLPRDAIEFVSGALGAWAAGRSWFVADPARASEVVSSLVPRLGATAVVGESRDGTVATSAVPTMAWDSPPAPFEPTDGEEAHIVTYAMTSGSTAEPKLLPVRGRLYRDLVAGRSDEAEPGRGDVLMAAFSHVGVGLYLPIAAALLGAPLWSFDPIRIAPSAILPRAAELGVTYWLTVPSLLRRLLALEHTAHPVPSLRTVATSGEALHGEDVQSIRTVLGPDVMVAQRYGATEVGPIARHFVGPGDPAPPGPLPAGRPRDGIVVTIVDDAELPVPPGSVGRIRVEGELGALNRDAMDLGDGQERLVLSDLGSIGPDGLLRLAGREDRMVKVGGVRVEPGAVEDVLRRVPGVREVAVVPVPIPGGEHRLVAHVVLDRPDAVTPEALRAAARASLTSMAVPARFVLGTDPLPLLPNGKLDRRSLIDRSRTA